MFEFLLMLFLGRSVLLTAEPMNLSGTTEIVLKAPLKAVSGGARLGIDVSTLLSIRPEESISDFRDRARREFPPEVFSALLQSSDGRSVRLGYTGNVEIGKTTVVLSLISSGPMPTDQAFNRLSVSSAVPVRGVKLIWTNYSL